MRITQGTGDGEDLPQLALWHKLLSILLEGSFQTTAVLLDKDMVHCDHHFPCSCNFLYALQIPAQLSFQILESQAHATGCAAAQPRENGFSFRARNGHAVMLTRLQELVQTQHLLQMFVIQHKCASHSKGLMGQATPYPDQSGNQVHLIVGA